MNEKTLDAADLRDRMYAKLDDLEWTVRLAHDEQDVNGLVQMAQDIRSLGIEFEFYAASLQAKLAAEEID